MSSRHRSRCFLATIAALAALAASPVLADANPVPMAEPESVGMSSERLKRIGAGMRRLIDANKIPGTVTLVARRGKVVHFETNGLRNIAAGLPMEQDTIFRLYSQSKPVTGAAVMILFEEGYFLLTDPVSKYLPEFADMHVYLGRAGRRDGHRTDGAHHHPAARDPHLGPDLWVHSDGCREDVHRQRGGRDRYAAAHRGG